MADSMWGVEKSWVNREPPDTIGSKPIYTETQLEAYLKRIKYKSSKSQDISLVQDVRQRIQSDALGTLTDLQRHHLAAISLGELRTALFTAPHHFVAPG
ncbi:uncharacterized protein N7477_005350 [Penicillium maclennaniae]|uniref:uncharacterized protein n=1 Tax=Penicillium maclennaniae TaxID=1343394 RepID=UPI0025415275|nr:uncharacterized protein N7477_005350 [Penicillium maclennaniae]KAJ5669987.1 hypothetical protein N7477_005350 [Penicillium maclennaniae]